MNPDLFRTDLLAVPDRLTDFATDLRSGSPWSDVPITRESRILLLGMGSSHYADAVAAARLRSGGVQAVAELASSDLLPPPTAGLVVLAVSASGGSAETLDAMSRYVGRCPVVAITNAPGSAISEGATQVIDMAAGAEVGGVACRTFRHTLALLLDLEGHLVGGPSTAATVEQAAAATADLLARRDDWLGPLVPVALGPDGTHLVAPVRRLSSAMQGALMLREGPRLPAVGCETGDWSHVDVYLTKTTDYRLVLFAGSRWEPELLRWVAERGSTLVSVGADVPGAAMSVRYAGDDVDDVRLLAEVLVPELLASAVWEQSPA